MKSTSVIALLTDFGHADAYAGTMKGVILSICPSACLVDLTHAIEPQNVRQAAYVLMTAVRYFPAHTVFLVVVDPGVGTEREPIAVAIGSGFFVAPNNGVLSYALSSANSLHAVILENPNYCLPEPSATFHGRDILSPAAAHLANGVSIDRLGPPLPALHQLDDPELRIALPQVRGEVLHIDHFGNIITSIGHLVWTSPSTLRLTPQFGPDRSLVPMLDATACAIRIGTIALHAIQTTYASVSPGTLTALVGSSGQLEIALNQGSAARVLGVSTGDPVTIEFAS